MSWIKVLPREQLPDGHRRVVEANGRPILLLSVKGQLHAVDNVCPHMGASLEDGQVTDDGTIVCPRHHSTFDLHTGEVIRWSPWPPGVGRMLGSLSREKALSVYATRVEDGSIWVDVQGLD